MSTVSHAQAADIIRNQWFAVHGRSPSHNEIIFTQAVAWLETNYGRAGQHGKLAANGQYNWANIEKARSGDVCPEGWAPGVDQGNVCFRVYPSDEEAARGLIEKLTKSHWPVIAAMQEGTPEAVAKAMKVKPAYYAADEALYARAIQNSLNVMKQSPVAAPRSVAAVTKSHGPIIAIGSVAAFAFGYWYFGKRK